MVVKRRGHGIPLFLIDHEFIIMLRFKYINVCVVLTNYEFILVPIILTVSL